MKPTYKGTCSQGIRLKTISDSFRQPRSRILIKRTQCLSHICTPSLQKPFSHLLNKASCARISNFFPNFSILRNPPLSQNFFWSCVGVNFESKTSFDIVTHGMALLLCASYFPAASFSLAMSSFVKRDTVFFSVKQKEF